MPDQDLPWAIYARRSRLLDKPRKNATGRRRAEDETVERQVRRCLDYAKDRDIPTAPEHTYIDNGKTAWKPDGKRPDWDRLIAAAKRGEIRGVLGIKIDRFARNPRPGEDLIEASKTQPLLLDGPYSGRIDLATAHGRRSFRDAVVQAAGESDNTSERVRDVLADLARQGYILAGGRLFGFEVLNDVEVPDDVTAVTRPAEVAIIREVASRTLAGEPLARLAVELNERGVTTTRGGRWTGGNLGRMLAHPQYGGWIDLHGKRVGRIKGEPILDESTFEDVQALLASRRRGRRASGRWPLTGAMICGNPKCTGNHTLAGHTEHKTGVRRYVCAPSNGGCGLSIRADETEAIVTGRVLADLADTDVAERLSDEAAAINEARVAAAAEVDRLDEQLADLEVKRAAGEIRERAYGRAKPVLDRRIADAERDLEDLSAASRQARTLPAVTEDEWEAMTPAEKRQLIGRLRLRVTIMPLPEGVPRNRFCVDRVVIEP